MLKEHGIWHQACLPGPSTHGVRGTEHRKRVEWETRGIGWLLTRRSCLLWTRSVESVSGLAMRDAVALVITRSRQKREMGPRS